MQLHPTSLCNLACKHCYSNSGPLGVGMIGVETFSDALKVLRRLGYTELALSGGEPTLYKHLPALLQSASDLHFSISLISNGLQSQRVVEAAQSGTLASIAISFDGLQASHDDMRLHPGAYARAVESLEQLVETRQQNKLELEIGASVAVTAENLGEIPTLVHSLAEMGIDHVNLHPVTPTGRALEMGITGLCPDEYLRLFLVRHALQQELPNLLVTSDVYNSGGRYPRPKVGDLISPLVIREDGDIVPFTYGVPKHLRIGTVWDWPKDLCFDSRLVDWVEEAHLAASNKAAGNFYHELELCAPPEKDWQSVFKSPTQQ